jgi:hypothetical protein
MINYKELRSGNLFATNFDKEIYELNYISPRNNHAILDSKRGFVY